MVEFLANGSKFNGYQRDRNEARIRFRIETLKCNPQLNNWNYGSRGITIFMNNLEWFLSVVIDTGNIGIVLRCFNQIIKTQPTNVKSSLRILNNNSDNEIVLEENLPEVTFNEDYEYKHLVENYEVDAQHRTGEWITMELLLTCQPILPNDNNGAANPQSQLQQQPTASTSHAAAAVQTNHDAEMLRQELARMRTANDALKKDLESYKQDEDVVNRMRTTIDALNSELAYYKQDEDAMKMFVEVMRLFRSKAVKKFDYKMQLNDDVKVHLLMVPIQTYHDANSQDDQSIASANTIDEYKRKVDQMEAEIAQLRQENANLKAGKCSERMLGQDDKTTTTTSSSNEMNDVDLVATGGMEATTSTMISRHDLPSPHAHLEVDARQHHFEAFDEALSLFKRRICNEFKFNLKLSSNTAVQVHMVAAIHDANDTKSNYNDDEKQQQYEQRQKELEALVRELRQRLEVAESKVNQQINN